MPGQVIKGSKVMPWDNAWRMLSNPQSFFSLLRESSAAPALGWMAGGIGIIVFIGGLLSVLLSLIVGVSLSDILAFVASDKTWLAYVIFLVLWYLKLVVFSLIVMLMYYGGSKILRTGGSFAASAQMLSYAATPVFLAFSLPQVLTRDSTIFTPVMRLMISSFNFSVDMIQVSSLVWAVWLMYIGSRELYGFSKVRSWMFVIVPGMGLAIVVGGYLFVEGLLIG